MNDRCYGVLLVCLLALSGCVGVAGPAGYGPGGAASAGPVPMAAGGSYYAPAAPAPAASSYTQPGPPPGLSESGGTFLGRMMHVEETPEDWYEKNKPQRMVVLMKCRQNPNLDQDPNCMAAVNAEAHEEQFENERFMLP